MDYKVRFIFTKKGFIKYISHLDLMRLFRRAMRRAGLPLKMTEGFNPHSKLSIIPALKLGVESDNQEGIIILRQQTNAEDFRNKLQKELPEGIDIRDVRVL